MGIGHASSAGFGYSIPAHSAAGIHHAVGVVNSAPHGLSSGFGHGIGAGIGHGLGYGFAHHYDSHIGHHGFGFYAGFGYYSPYYYPPYGSYGVYANPSYYDESFTYPPVYIESEETLDTYEDGAVDVARTALLPAVGPDASNRTDDELFVPDGIVLPHPLIEPNVAPEILPPEDEAGTSGGAHDAARKTGANKPRPNSHGHGVRT